MSKESSSEFGKWRAFFWPIHCNELKKFVPMLLIFFLIAFNYNLLRSLKDSLVITAKHSGAEVLPFIKVWVILPMAISFTLLFTRLLNRFSQEKVFYIVTTSFLVLFFIFAFVLYPAREYLHPHQFADSLQAILPAGFKGLIAIFRNWTFTLFYALAELWSTAMLSVLFWGFANEVTHIHQAKRFYGLFLTGANIASVFAGQVAVFCSGKTLIPFSSGSDPWEGSILFFNCIVIVFGIFIMALFRWVNKHVIRAETKLNKEHVKETPKVKMSMRKNFSYLAQSKYLIFIAIIVLSYNLTTNLAEIVWKNQIKELYPDPGSYNVYTGKIASLTGMIATIVSIFFSAGILRRFSWTFSALIPPLVMLFTGVFFFSFVIFPSSGLTGLAAFLGTTPLILSVTFGSLQNCLSRAAKFTLFDATKEMAFIPLSPESRLKGKAAIDGIGSRLGKSGGSMIHQGMLLLFASVAGSTPVIGAIFLMVIGIWVTSAVSLGTQFDALTQEKVVPQETKSPLVSQG